MILVLIGFLLVYWWGMPRIVMVSPAPDEMDVSASTEIIIEFSRQMQLDSILEHLTIEPEISYSSQVDRRKFILTPKAPWISGEAVRVELKSGARSIGLIPLVLSKGIVWSFKIRQPGLLYLYPADGPSNLYLLNLDSEESIPVTSHPNGIEDFSINAEGTAIYYSARSGSSRSEIFRIELAEAEEEPVGESGSLDHNFYPVSIYICPQALCRQPVASPDENYLAFERIALPGSDGPDYPQVWYIALNQDSSSEAEGVKVDQPKAVLVGNVLHETLLPSWSSNGLLCFYDTNSAAYLFLDPVSQDIITFPNQTGQGGDWHPDGDSFIAPEIMFLKTSEAIDDLEQIANSHLMLFNITDGSVQDLTPGGEIEDVNPAFSPDGQRLVFARKFLDVERWTPGRQIWLLDLKGENLQQLLQEPLYNHFDFSWNPSGEQIAYIRFNQSTLNEPPEIWLIDLRSGLNERLVINGYAPQWLP